MNFLIKHGFARLQPSMYSSQFLYFFHSFLPAGKNPELCSLHAWVGFCLLTGPLWSSWPAYCLKALCYSVYSLRYLRVRRTETVAVKRGDVHSTPPFIRLRMNYGRSAVPLPQIVSVLDLCKCFCLLRLRFTLVKLRAFLLCPFHSSCIIT